MPERTIEGYIVVVEPSGDPTPEECPACGFDALLEFPCYVLWPSGVSNWPPVRACARCYDEAHREEA